MATRSRETRKHLHRIFISLLVIYILITRLVPLCQVFSSNGSTDGLGRETSSKSGVTLQEPPEERFEKISECAGRGFVPEAPTSSSAATGMRTGGRHILSLQAW